MGIGAGCSLGKAKVHSVPYAFSIGSLGLAVAGASACVVLLKLMRKAVGPLKAGKSKSRDYR